MVSIGMKRKFFEETHLQNECQWHICSNDGCEWIGDLMEKLSHEQNCPDRLASCSNESNGCTKNVKNKEMSIHLQQECTAHNCPNDACEWIGNKMQEGYP